MIQNFYAQLDTLYVQGKQDEIEKFLKKKIKDIPCLTCHYDPLVVAVYSELGSFYRGRGRLKEAIKWFESALQLIVSHLGENTMEYATEMNNLAGAQRMDGQNDEAAMNFSTAMRIYEKLVGQDNYYYISCVNNLSLLEINRQDYGYAKELLLKVLTVLEGKQELLQEKAITLCNLGTCESYRKNDDLAEQYLRQAEEIYRSFPSGQQVHLAAVCNSLGRICYHKGDKVTAAKAYEEAKELTELYFGRSVEYAVVCENLSRCLNGQEAVAMLREGMSALEVLDRKESLPYRRMKKTLEGLEVG